MFPRQQSSVIWEVTAVESPVSVHHLQSTAGDWVHTNTHTDSHFLKPGKVKNNRSCCWRGQPVDTDVPVIVHSSFMLSLLSPTSFVPATYALLPICPFCSPSLPVLLFWQCICSSRPLSFVLAFLVSCSHSFFLIRCPALSFSLSVFLQHVHSTWPTKKDLF